MRDYDAAIAQFAKMLELYPDYAAAHKYFGDVCERKGMFHEAITQWRAGLTLSHQPEQAQLLEETFAVSGFDDAVRVLAQKQLQQLNEKSARGEYVPAWHYLMAHLRLGHRDQAFTWLAKTVEEPNWFALQIKVNPILDELRSDPRFEALTQKIFAKGR